MTYGFKDKNVITLYPNGYYYIHTSDKGRWKKNGRIYTLNSLYSPYVIDSVEFEYSKEDTAKEVVIEARFRNGYLPKHLLVFLRYDNHEDTFYLNSPEPLIIPKGIKPYERIWVAVDHKPWERLTYAVSDYYDFKSSDSIFLVLDARIPSLWFEYCDNKSFIRKNRRLVPVFD